MLSTLRAVALTLFLAALGACTTLNSGAFEGVTGAVATRVAFEGTVGVPEAVLPRFMAELEGAARARGLTLVPSTDTTAPYVMRGYLAPGRGAIAYVFDLYERANGSLAIRLDGQAPAAGQDPFTAENGRALRDIAALGFDGVQRFVASPRQPSAVLEPRAERVQSPTGREEAAGPRSLARTAFVEAPSGLDAHGSSALRNAMRRSLGSIGFDLTESASTADVRVSADVTLNPAERGRQRLAVIWTLDDRSGANIGEVQQLTQVPEGALPGRWERTATAAAEHSLPGVVALLPQ